MRRFGIKAVAALPVGLALLLLAGCGTGTQVKPGPVAGWPAYGGDDGGSHSSVASDITPRNVQRLEKAWEYHTHEDFSCLHCKNKAFEATPILADGKLIFSTPSNRIIALHPENGAKVWEFDPHLDYSHGYSEYTSRGVSAWTDPRAAAEALCATTIFEGTVDARLLAVDAKTGQRCSQFGSNGEVDLSSGIHVVDVGDYQVTSPPAIVNGLVIIGSAIGDNRAVELERGIVRAYDAKTGELRWSWDPIPRDASDPARATWKTGADKTGGANAWSLLSADPERDLVFIPTTSPSPDFYGGERLGDNRNANSVVALRASTGKLVWAYQVVHHDVWDFDIPAQPVLVTVRRDGKDIPAVAQATKMGFLFVLNRETGEPLFPVVERPVPQTDVAGEQTSPTQPFPVLPLPVMPHNKMSAKDAWGLTPFDRKACADAMRSLRSEGIYTPPSLKGTLLFPAYSGGTNWGSLGFDRKRHWAVVNTTRLPFAVRLIPRAQAAAERAKKLKHAEYSRQRGTPYEMVRYPLLSPLGMPCNAPPWGALTAVDLDSGKTLWEVPLGTIRDLAPIPLPIEWGTPNMGGPLVTGSGLVFIGAAMDSYLRAFDIESGKELWKGRLPAGGQATPMTYKLSAQGKQYVVIGAGGHGKLGSKLGDSVVAYALAQ